MNNVSILIPMLCFLAFMIILSIMIRRQQESSGRMKNFVQQYFIGNRDLGGFVLAMTTVATYSSVSSFVGGPGMAWQVGFGWIYMAIVQITAIFLVLGVFGKRVALISRKINAVTIIDIIRTRYQSDLLANISAFIIVLFFCATMVAQFVGGAKLFETVTGYSYLTGLLLFGLIVIFYTAIGGFRAVAITDAWCAIMMLIGIGLLLYFVLDAGDGYHSVMTTIETLHPQMLEPLAGGNMPYSLYFTQWLLVGIFTIALPQSVVRGISYKETKGLHQAMLIGTVIIGAMTIGVNLIGVFARGFLMEDLSVYGGVDYIIPLAIIKTMPPFLAGIAIIGPIAATISTVSSLLIVSSSAMIKDIYMHHQEKQGQAVSLKKVRRISTITTASIGIIVFVISLVPPSVIWLINMFAFGGLETAFFWTLLLGLFWRKANRTGALLSMAGGTIAYCLSMAYGFKIMGLHQIVIGIVSAGILFIIGSYLGKQEDAKTLNIFFPRK